MSEKKDYFDYIENVLGVKSVLLDPASDPVSFQSVPLLFAVENYNSYNVEENELLGKMISALKIDLQKIKITELQETTGFQTDFCVYFVDDINAKTDSEGPTLKTYSPRFLLKNPDAKKQAWSDLQKVIQFFKSR